METSDAKRNYVSSRRRTPSSRSRWRRPTSNLHARRSVLGVKR
jgi:hypothetical protein